MRRYVLVLAMTTLILPSVLCARPLDHASAAASTEATPTAAPATTPVRDPSQQKSLLGLVMAALIESAEQQSTAQQASRRPAKAEADAVRPPTQADHAIEQVAVQAEP